MSTALWIAQVLLALAFVAAGTSKLTKSRDELSEMGMSFVEDASDTQVRGIGLVEVLGGLGLLLPAVTGILPILTPIAAVGLAITMVAAGAVHLRRDEVANIAVNVALGGLAVFVAWGRFGPEAL